MSFNRHSATWLGYFCSVMYVQFLQSPAKSHLDSSSQFLSLLGTPTCSLLLTIGHLALYVSEGALGRHTKSLQCKQTFCNIILKNAKPVQISELLAEGGRIRQDKWGYKPFLGGFRGPQGYTHLLSFSSARCGNIHLSSRTQGVEAGELLQVGKPVVAT